MKRIHQASNFNIGRVEVRGHLEAENGQKHPIGRRVVQSEAPRHNTSTLIGRRFVYPVLAHVMQSCTPSQTKGAVCFSKDLCLFRKEVCCCEYDNKNTSQSYKTLVICLQESKKQENLLQSLFKQMSLFLWLTSAIASESYSLLQLQGFHSLKQIQNECTPKCILNELSE